MDIRRFLAELKGRGVYRVAALYAAGSWALLQVADLLFPIFGLPDWAIRGLLAVVALCFPVALLLAWIFDITPEGIVETSAARVDFGKLQLSPYRLAEMTLILVLVGLVGYLYFDRLMLERATSAGSQDNGVAQEDGRPSIAVMAFDNMSEDPSAEYFGDGLAEEILNLLARLNELRVAARTSSFYFKNKNVDLRDVGAKLGVGYILEGSVRRSGNRVRVTAQLVEMKHGYHLWSRTFDRDYSSSFEIQEEIARHVVDKLEVILSTASREILTEQPAVDPRAYDYYLRGREYLRGSLGEEGINKALEMFSLAVSADPDYAQAYAGLCDSRLQLYAIKVEARHFDSAEAACHRALEMGGNQVPVLVALGNLYRMSGELEQAASQYNRALALNPESVDAMLGLAMTYHADNRDALAEQTYRAAIELDPGYWLSYMNMGGFLFATGRYRESLEYYQKIANLMPDKAETFNSLAAAYYMLGEFEPATQAMQRSLEIAPSGIAYSNVGTTQFYLGHFREASDLYLKALEYAPEDSRYWGNLGDAYRHAEGLQAFAEPAFKKAIQLAEESLAINPSDASTLGLLAHYHASVGDREQALQYITKARALAPNDVYVHYNAATALCSLGEVDSAAEELSKAVAMGYPIKLVGVDANLCALAQRPEFQSATAGAN